MNKDQITSNTIEGWINKLLKDHEASSMDDLSAETTGICGGDHRNFSKNCQGESG